MILVAIVFYFMLYIVNYGLSQMLLSALYFRRKFFVEYQLGSSSLRGQIEDGGGRSSIRSIAVFHGS